MKLIIQALFVTFATLLNAQEDLNLELLAHIPIDEAGNDVWGYVDTNGVEYAVFGSRTHTRIYSLEDPRAPQEVAKIKGASSSWRDMKSYKNYIYVTTDDFNAGAGEEPDGLTIIDMTHAPDSITFKRWQPDIAIEGGFGRLGECHNLYIDTVQGYCYLAGCQGIGRAGVLILDIHTDPLEPKLVGFTNDNYTHDVFVLDDRMYNSDILAGFLSIYDVSDKSNPQLLSTTNTTTFFTHNAWASSDNKYVFTTDEKPNGKLDAYDVSDPTDVKRLDFFVPVDRYSERALPHNTHFLDGFLITSWYTEGVVVTDGNRPENMIKVAQYDTYKDEASLPEGSTWFRGLWGAYPYLPSGLLLGSDINSGLYVWQPFHTVNGDTIKGYQRASYLEGKITDAYSGEGLEGATVTILSDDANMGASNVAGGYKTGQATPGTFKVVYAHPNYENDTLDITLVSGEVVIQDVALSSNVVTFNTRYDNDPLDGVQISAINRSTGFEVSFETDEQGEKKASLKAGDVVDIYAGKWGYKGVGLDSVVVTADQVIDLDLEKGYEDDFFADLGWTVTSTATTGAWELGVPEATMFSGVPGQLGADVEGDLGVSCYATGLTGTTAGSNDIDGGSTTLTSPAMDFSEYKMAEINYSLFFANGGGADGNAPDDSLFVRLSNGIDEIILPGLDTSVFDWTSMSVMVTDETIAFTDSMTLIFVAGDWGEGHIAEGMVDQLSVVLSGSTSTPEEHLSMEVLLSPNPIVDRLTIKSESSNIRKVSIYGMDGKSLSKHEFDARTVEIDTNHLNGGQMYLVHVVNTQGQTYITKVVKL